MFTGSIQNWEKEINGNFEGATISGSFNNPGDVRLRFGPYPQ
jgi:hypothetical protein